MTFLNPFAWLAALAAAVPLLVHLLSRRKARREVFPTVRFLRQVHRQEVRRLRLREWLLLLLRTLAVLCLALAFGRPAVQGSLAGSSHAPTSMLVLVDRSLSMRASGARGSRFEEARARLRELGELMEPGSEIQLLGFERQVAPVFEDFIHDPARYRSSIQSIKPGYGGTDLTAALREGGRWLTSRRGLHRELFVISDFQAVGLDSARAGGVRPALQGLEVYWVPAGARDAANAGWLSAEATRVGTGGEIDGAIRNASDEPRRGILVEARVGARLVGATRVDLAARADTHVRVPLTALQPGDLGAMVSFPHDVLEDDDRIAVAFPSSRPLSVLLVGPPSQRVYVEAALKASPDAFQIQTSEDGSSAGPAEVWVLLDPERVNAASLRAHLERGGGVLAVLGDGYASRQIELALGELAPGAALAAEGDSSHRSFARLRVVDPGYAPFRGLTDRRGGTLSSARFYRMVRVKPAPGATTRAEFGPDSPALIERGHVLFLTSSLDGRWNDFPLTPSFIPWLYQTLETLGSRSRALAVDVGQRWLRPLPADWKGLPLRLLDPDRRSVPVDLLQGGSELRSAALDRPGLYPLEVAGRPLEAVAVKLPASEADLRALSPSALAALAPRGHRVEGSLREAVLRQRHGRELWRDFVVAALLLFVVETLVARYTVAERV